MKKDLLLSLKKELENSFGRKIASSRDCNQLVEEIFQKTGETINANTLRRFFGLVKADYPPSSSTLTILARYCGFNSVDEVNDVSAAPTSDTDIHKEEILRYMISLFRSTEVASHQERVFFPIVEQTITFLERNPSLIDKFQREIAKTTTGQYYYYERLVNMDHLNDYYGEGLRHYLRVKRSDEGRVFAKAMLVFRAWLNGNNEELVKNVSEINKMESVSGFPDHILGRLIAAKVYHAHIRDIPIDGIVAEAKRYHGGIIARREDSPFAFPDYELIICEALLLTGHYEEGAEFVWHGKTYLAASGQEKNTLYDIWEDLANVRRSGKSRKKVTDNKKEPVHHGFPKKYNTIIWLLSQDIAQSKHSQNSQQFRDLVRQTGYRRLLSLITGR